jgi:hypothetical protein
MSVFNSKRVTKALQDGVNSAPMTRSDAGATYRAAKAYKLKNDITIYNRRHRKKTT